MSVHKTADDAANIAYDAANLALEAENVADLAERLADTLRKADTPPARTAELAVQVGKLAEVMAGSEHGHRRALFTALATAAYAEANAVDAAQQPRSTMHDTGLNAAQRAESLAWDDVRRII